MGGDLSKFDRAALAIAKHAKDRFTKNIDDPQVAPIWQQLSPRQRQVLAVLFDGSVDEGLAAALPRLRQLHSDEVTVGLEARAYAAQLGHAKEPTDRKLLAAFTMARNEPVWLTAWCRYYARHADTCVVFVEPGDETVNLAMSLFPSVEFVACPAPTDWAGVENSTGQQYADFERWRALLVKELQGRFLEEHAWALFTDTDEFLVPDDPKVTLRQFCERNPRAWHRATGFSVVQGRDEVELDPCDPLRDRASCRPDPGYDKVLLVQRPIDYSNGFHHRLDAEGDKCYDDPRSALSLVHLDKCSFEGYMQRTGSKVGLSREEARELFDTGKCATYPTRSYPLEAVSAHWRAALQ